LTNELPNNTADPKQLKTIKNKSNYFEQTIENLKKIVEEKEIEPKISKKTQNSSLWSCDECDKYFKVKGGLQAHVRSVHEVVKYPCNKCEYEATASSHLKLHIKVVHEGVKYPCNLCDYRPSSRSNLRKHMNRKHIKSDHSTKN